jgi:hypothetical protein
MKKLINLRKAWAKLSAHRAKLRFCLRTTVAGLFAFAIAELTSIPLNGLWVVLTAVVVTQLSVGGSLRATLEYIIGTVGGAILPHTTPGADDRPKRPTRNRVPRSAILDGAWPHQGTLT